MNNFTTRTISGIVFVLVMLAGLLLDRFVFAAIFLFIMTVMMEEFFRMTLGREYRYSRLFAIITGIVLFLLVFSYSAFNLPTPYLAIAILPLFLSLVVSIFEDGSSFTKTSYIFAGVLYIAIPWALINFIAFKNGEFSGLLILCLFMIIWASDIGAYVFGTAFGQKYGK